MDDCRSGLLFIVSHDFRHDFRTEVMDPVITELRPFPPEPLFSPPHNWGPRCARSAPRLFFPESKYIKTGCNMFMENGIHQKLQACPYGHFTPETDDNLAETAVFTSVLERVRWLSEVFLQLAAAP